MWFCAQNCLGRWNRLPYLWKIVLLKWWYFARNTSRQIEDIPAYQADVYGQLATTLQATRLPRCHMDMQLQELYNIYSVMDRIDSDEEPEMEWKCFSSFFWEIKWFAHVHFWKRHKYSFDLSRWDVLAWCGWNLWSFFPASQNWTE